jgi:hypothetical protein
MADAIYAIDDFPDDDFLWRIVWIGGVGYNPSAPSDPLIDVCLAQLPRWRDKSAQRTITFLANQQNGEDRCWLAPLHRISDNAGGVKHFLSVLIRALRRARHFALVEAVPFQPRLARC